MKQTLAEIPNKSGLEWEFFRGNTKKWIALLNPNSTSSIFINSIENICLRLKKYSIIKKQLLY